ncbi:GNAT family N-acetyltransferase [Aeromonas salmonicida]|uniref:GNAT family N-acetyltransferase n=1 Tax=Aeromonas salmonicida TaxID=645 RepID=UPI000E93A30C|nr:GNAT family N-acetyltransferase [Aeromonas salmonicida]MUG28989.1 GNAT family N-acetyltransferase [Aeromonas salmonicida]HAT07181.1 N-acetyltransferase [Aeromonas salmonicida]HBL02426.1 N-acetyltransferase [Aeromonas salmonicida]
MQTELRRLLATDGPALQRLFELAPAYQAAVSHEPLSARAAEEALVAYPPDLSLSDKYLIGHWEQGELTAVIDLLRGYPNPDTAYLGLLLVGEPWQGSGRGQSLYLHACTLARSWGATLLRLSVIASNESALSFWLRRGFIECYRRELAVYRAEAIVLERTLEP